MAQLDFYERVDMFLFHLINSDWCHSYFDVFFPAITDLHKTDIFKFLFIPFVIFLFIYWKKLEGLFIFIGLIVTLGFSDWLGGQIKQTVMRQRPFQTNIEVIQRSGAGSYSFPSNHAMNMFCAAMFLTYFFPRYRWLFFIFAFLVSYSRIYNGVHYPSDVIFGGCLGIFIAYAGTSLTNYFINKLNSRKTQNV